VHDGTMRSICWHPLDEGLHTELTFIEPRGDQET
jgi:hypothetical protein